MSAVQKPTPALTHSKPATPVPVLALNVEQACQSLGVSFEFWRDHIAADVKVIRLGRRRIVAVSELQRWLDSHGEAVG